MFSFLRNKQRTSENLLYFLVWSSILLVPLLNTVLTSQSRIIVEEVMMAWLKISPFIFIFFIHNNIVAPRALSTRQYGQYTLVVIGLILAVFTPVDFVQRNIFATLPMIRDIDPERMTLTDISLSWNVFLSLFMCTGNTGIKLIYKSMRDDQLMEALKHQNLQVEMDYLKYQINPHFFMNTLNNIHALIDIDSESAKDAVIELSKMMRYVLYESGNESISLKQDLIFIENYIKLMQIRYDEMVDVRFRYPAELPQNASMPPLLLIVFIENAFKHGVRAIGKSFVNIDVECVDGKLHFTATNSLAPTTNKSKSSGIGLINVRKRLELLYEKNFELHTITRQDDYFVHLVIPLQ